MVSEYTDALMVIQARIPNVYSNAHYLSEHEGPLFASLVLSSFLSLPHTAYLVTHDNTGPMATSLDTCTHMKSAEYENPRNSSCIACVRTWEMVSTGQSERVGVVPD